MQMRRNRAFFLPSVLKAKYFGLIYIRMTSIHSSSLTGSQFKAWRESHGLTQNQIAERMRVTRTTIQNWEAASGLVPLAASMAASVWDARLKQEDPFRGPVTLIYADGPMFVDPYGPRRRPAMMQQESYPSNATALARVQALWGRPAFENPLIIEKDGSLLWNSVELGRVVEGSDLGAPTLVNLLHKTAQAVRENSHIFVRSGARSLTPAETKQRQEAIEAQADALDEIANAGLEAAIEADKRIEAIFQRLRDLGTRAPDDLVSAVSHAIEIFGQTRGPRIEGPNYVLDYKGFQISWPRVPMMSNATPVEVTAEIMSQFSRIDRSQFPIMAPNVKDGVRRAKAYIDTIE
jgi:DNA-binding XRE family transcriptional regulator